MIAVLVALGLAGLWRDRKSPPGAAAIRGFYGYSHCGSTWTKIPDPVRDPEQEHQDAVARQKEADKWEQFCKPSFRHGEFGVCCASQPIPKQGCEFGPEQVEFAPGSSLRPANVLA